MARIRTIKPEFFTSDDIIQLPPLARLLYVGLWTEADREGRIEWKPKAFKRRLLPDDECDIESLCQSLVNANLIVTYGDQNQYAFIPTFLEHQNINPREAQSKIPPPPPMSKLTRENLDHAMAQSGSARVVTRENLDCDASPTRENLDLHPSLSRSARVTTRENLDDVITTGKGKEGKGKERKGKEPEIFSDEISKSSEPNQEPEVSEHFDETESTAEQVEESPQTFVGFINDTPEGLARLFRSAKAGGPNSQESEEACIQHIQSAIRSGATAAKILAEIQNRDRNRAEAIWQLLSRCTPRAPTGPGTYGKPKRLTPRQVAGVDPV